MRTIETKLFKFEELSEEAKETALQSFEPDTAYIYDEAHATVKAFHEVFGTKEGLRSWLDISTEHIDDDILELSGIRLRTYIENNFGDQIRQGKYFSLWSKKDKNPHYTKNGFAPWGKLKSRHSKIMQALHSCPFTGVCYDEGILYPVYQLLENFLPENDPQHYTTFTFEDLMQDCISELDADIEREVEHAQSMEYFQDEAEANEYEFTANGKRH